MPEPEQQGSMPRPAKPDPSEELTQVLVQAPPSYSLLQTRRQLLTGQVGKGQGPPNLPKGHTLKLILLWEGL